MNLLFGFVLIVMYILLYLREGEKKDNYISIILWYFLYIIID